MSYWTSGSFGGIQWDTALEYLGEFEKGQDYDGRIIDDVSTANFKFGVYATSNLYIMLELDDIMNNRFEVLPDYAAGGRTVRLSFDRIL